MAGLSHCLKKIGLSKHEAAILKGDAKEYVGEGYEAHKAAVQAVQDHIADLMAEWDDIVEQIQAQIGTKTDLADKKNVDSAITEASRLGEENPQGDVAELRNRALDGVNDADSHDIDAVTESVHEGQYLAVRKIGEAMPVKVLETDISRDLANRAFSGTSHTPEKRAKVAIRDYVRTLVSAWKNTEENAKTPEDRLRLTEQFRVFKDGYVTRLNSYLSAHSRVVSTFIVGPAKFPTSSNAKKSNSADNRAAELLEWEKKGVKRLNDAAKGPTDRSPASEAENARRKLQERQKSQDAMKAANKIVRDKSLSDDQKVAKIVESGLSEKLAREALKPDFMGRIGFPDYALKNNNAETRRLTQRVSELEGKQQKAEETGGRQEFNFDGGMVELDYADGTLRIRHDAKPPEEVRTKLKSNGFHWSPTNTAWQRKITDNAIAAAERITGAEIKTKETDQGTELLHRTSLFNQIAQIELMDPPQAEANSVQAGIEGKTPIEAARFIANNGNEPQKLIAQKVLVQLQKLKMAGVRLDLKVAHLGDDVPSTLLIARGLTKWNLKANNNHITVWLNGSDVTGKVGVSYETLLHELVHMATAAIVHLGSLKQASPYKSRKDVNDLLAVTRHIQKYFKQRVADSEAGKVQLTDFEERLSKLANNALADANEVLAWGLSNPNAQAYMESIPYREHESAWTAFVSAIRKLMGIPEQAATAFTEVLRVADNLMSDNVNDILGLDAGYGQNTAIQSEFGSGILPQLDEPDQGKVLFSLAEEPIFYSQLARAIESAKQTSMPAKQWALWLNANRARLGIKLDEIEAVGLNEFLDLQQGSVTKEAVLEFVRQNGVQIKEVTLGGNIPAHIVVQKNTEGTWDVFNKSEDNEDQDAKLNTSGFVHENDAIEFAREESERLSTPEEAANGRREATKFASYQLPGGKEYREVFLTLPDVKGYSWKDGHPQYADIVNPTVRIRMNERTDSEGKRTLFLEEVQGPSEENEERMPPWSTAENRTMQAIKWAIRYAAKNGLDRISWTTGEQQADRYDLSKVISKLHWYLQEDGNYKITADTKERGVAMPDQVVAPDKLADVVGKDVADKIIKGDGARAIESDETEYKAVGELSGLDLKVGGEGLKAFYDQMLPQLVNKYVKKWGGKVGEIELGTSKEVDAETAALRRSQGWNVSGNVVTNPTGVKVHFLDITPALRDAVMQGQALFQLQPKLQPAPTEAIHDTTETESARDLRRGIEAALGRPLKKGSFTQVGVPEHLRGLTEVISKVFKKKVVYIHNNIPHIIAFNGMAPKHNRTTIFLNVEADRPLIYIAGHELLHLLRREHTDIYNKLYRMALDEFRPEQVAAFTKKLDRARQQFKITGKTSEDLVHEEMLANFIGDQFGRPEFWSALYKSDPNMLQRMALLVRNFVTSILKAANLQGFSSEHYFNDLEKMRTAAIEALAEYARRGAQSTDEISSTERGADFALSEGRKAAGLPEEGYPITRAEAERLNYIGVYRKPTSPDQPDEEGWHLNSSHGPDHRSTFYYPGAPSRMEHTYTPEQQTLLREIRERKGEVPGAEFSLAEGGRVLSTDKITGDSGRSYSSEQRESFRNLGREITIPQIKDRVKALWKDAGKKLAQGLADQFAPVEEISHEAYLLLRLSKGTSGAFQVFLKGGKLKLTDGVYDFDDSQRGGVIERLLIPLQAETDDFLWWVAANRAEQLSMEDRENLFSRQDIEALKALNNGTTEFDYTIQHGANAGQVTRDRTLIYRDSLKTFNEFNKNALDMAEQSGLIDGDSRQFWEKEFYVPFYRVDEEEGLRGVNIKSGVVRQQAFKRLKGGSQKIHTDLLENTLMNWAHLLDAAAKNRAAKATLEAAEAIGVAHKAEGGEKKTVWYMGRVKHRIPEGQTYIEGGVEHISDGTAEIEQFGRVEYKVDDPYILTAISALEYADMDGPLMDAMSEVKHWLTIGVTASPFYKVRNLVRDSVHSIGVSPLSYNVAGNVAKGFALTDPKSDNYFRLLAGGGTIHFGTMLEGNESRRVRALVEAGVDKSTILDNEGKIKAFYKRVIEPAITAYNEIGNRGEAINRASLYDQLVHQGVSHAEASLMARDLMDFSMRGSWTTIRFLTQTVPFMNARIQGLYKLGRSAKDDPRKLSVVLGATAMFSIVLMLAYGDDDDWKKREDWDRDNYWWFKIGGTAFRIPKPFEIGAIATLAERGVELFASDEMTGERFRSRLYSLLSNNLSFNPVPQLVKPVLDIYSNKDSFTERPIETLGMERLRPDYRMTSRTTMTARSLSTAGNIATGDNFLSPVQVDHLIRGYFGWLGSFVVGSADVIARPATGQVRGSTPDYWKVATGGMIAGTDSAPSRYVTQMYEQVKEIEQAYATWRSLLKEGKRDEASAFREENLDYIKKHQLAAHIKREESKLNERIRFIERSNKSSDEKRDIILNLKDRKDKLARRLGAK